MRVSRLILFLWETGVVLSSGRVEVLAHDLHGKPAVVELPSHSPADYAFPLPVPGSYELPPIRKASGGDVLDERGNMHDLGHFFAGRVTVLAFIYTRCGDACPTASLQMSLLQDLASRDDHVVPRMRLLSVSFDPDHDTPQVMAEYAANWRSTATSAPDWDFVTAPHHSALAPILSAYGQVVDAPKRADLSDPLLHHVFRAFLIDPSGQIRNIYSLDFLDPDLVLNDIRSLLLEQDGLEHTSHTLRR
ncbi:SCO family protein [Microvirga puerhi]|uniref:SCO family protein n=1 Tax=Microvirga puerhi TaxID=2876078 RepID=A0ABS7VNJ4_9HYPH|nr:SCO family protein [Microvirga puerhi]MBZ6076665.1 SCO family protein [Microvirga puerhi]